MEADWFYQLKMNSRVWRIVLCNFLGEIITNAQDIGIYPNPYTNTTTI